MGWLLMTANFFFSLDTALHRISCAVAPSKLGYAISNWHSSWAYLSARQKAMAWIGTVARVYADAKAQPNLSKAAQQRSWDTGPA